MQSLNKKLYLCSLLLILCVALPLNGMFTQKTFGRLKQRQQKAAQKRPFGLSQQPMNVNIKQTIPQSAETKKPTILSLISNWWYGPSLEEKLSTWSTNVGTTIKTTATDLSKTTQLKKIIYQLKIGLNPSAQEILMFLHSDNKNDIKNLLNELIKHRDGNFFLKKICTQDPSMETKIRPFISEYLKTTLKINNEDTTTPSFKHLEKYALDIIRHIPGIFNPSMLTTVFGDAKKFSTILNQDISIAPNFITMIQNALKKEKELNDLGYETFYHGRRWKYGLLSDIWKMLFEYKSRKKLPNNFIPTHLDDPVLPILEEKINPLFFESEKAKHALLLKEGNIYPDQIGIAGYETLLFLNKFLFGNINDAGESSFLYMLLNNNQSDIKLSISEIFAMFGDSVVYNTYEQQLRELEQEYIKLNTYGELLLIAIPKNEVNKYIYYADSGGRKKPFNIPEVGKTTDIEKILEYQNKNPQDDGIYTLINTKTGGLNPKSGIKMFSFNAVDPDKMKAFKEKENALFAEIVQSMKEKDSKKEMEAASRE